LEIDLFFERRDLPMLELIGRAVCWTGYLFLVSSLAAVITVSILKQPAAKSNRETVAFRTIEPFQVFWLEGGR
jgi:hypothetical protein